VRGAATSETPLLLSATSAPLPPEPGSTSRRRASAHAPTPRINFTTATRASTRAVRLASAHRLGCACSRAAPHSRSGTRLARRRPETERSQRTSTCARARTRTNIRTVARARDSQTRGTELGVPSAGTWCACCALLLTLLMSVGRAAMRQVSVRRHVLVHQQLCEPVRGHVHDHGLQRHVQRQSSLVWLH
jgi:hypothetical protein